MLQRICCLLYTSNGQKAYVYAEFVTVAEKEIAEQQSTESSESSETSTDPDAPIVVNGSGREEVSSASRCV